MPEIKNTFIQGKMNKDLDPRIIPPGEYVDAKNIKVSRSENGDIGVVENILSNKKITNIPNSLSGTETIGHVVDFENRIVYFFLTNFDNANENVRANSTDHKCAIMKYDDNTDQTSIVFSTYRFNFNKSFPIYGVNIIDGFLFFTDNLNQPRVFNVEDTSSYVDDPYFEDKISVAKYAPYCAPQFLSPEYVLTVNGAVNNSATVTISAANTALQTAVGNGDKFLVRHDSIDDDVIINTLSSTTLTLSEAITIADGEKLTILGGSMFENTTDSTIDSEYLKEKFVRFSYRYKYKDNTYSIFAPFTQIAFIPKIDTFDATNKQEAYKEAEVADFVNKVNQLELEIMLPTLDPIANLFIKEIEILLKESDSIAVKVLDVIDIDNITELRKDVTTITKGSVGSTKLKAYINNVYSNVNERRKELYYVYRSEEPFKTLPESQTNRVYDNVPVKALAQEIAGNRVIYGNFVEGKELPSNGLNYELSTGSKNEEDEFTYEEYPRHTLKQNRTYVVGVVLADRYGRQSPVLLSSKHSSSILHKRSQISANGDSLKVIFNEQINENLWSVTNPLGWYSYRIVVKQSQQEYYNVYTPGVTIFNTASRGGNNTGDGYGYFPIFGDNINKIPRDEVTEGSNIDLSTSSVNLYDIVENGSNGIQTSQHSVIAIGDLDDFGITNAADTVEFYDPDKKYLFAQIKGDYGVNAGNDGAHAANLAVFETEPFKSKLDLFFETSSCGLISDLNAKINAPGSASPNSLVIRNLADTAVDDDFPESTVDDSFIFILKVYDADNNELTVSSDNLSISVQSVQRLYNSVNIGSVNDFSAENDNGVIKLKLVNAQQYLNSPANAFELVLRATTSGGANNFTKTIYITNNDVDLGFISPNTCVGYTAGETGVIATVNSSGEIYGYNGSGSTTLRTQNITYTKVSGDSRVNVSTNGAISLSSGIGSSETNISFVLRGTDVGNEFDDLTVPLCIDTSGTIDVTEKTGTGYNYYDRCYGQGQASGQDPGDKYQEYFIPSNNGYYDVTGSCNGDFEDILSNHVSYDETSSTPLPSNHKFSEIYVDGQKALDVDDFTWDTGSASNAFWVRVAPHANSTPGQSGYVGSSDSNFIVSVNNVDYELVIGYEQQGAVAEPLYRKLVKRNNITTL